jgi:glycosyltransferase involved in cell wall biosynthesis
MSPERVFVVPNAANREVFHPERDERKLGATLRRYGLHERPYILALSTLEPRKNLMHLLECFFEMCRDGSAGDSLLALVGPTGWMFEPTLERWRREPTFRQRVVFTGYVPDADLSSVYTGARLFVYVSRYEGFGLPPLEAMSCGVPPVVSNTSALPEFVDGAGLMVHPDDSGGLREAMGRLLADDELRAQVGARALARAQEFSWERSAAQIVDVYRRVIEAS